MRISMVDAQNNASYDRQLSVLVVHNSYQRRGGEDSVVSAESELLTAMGMRVEPLIYDSRDTIKLRELIRHPDYLVFNQAVYEQARALIRQRQIQLVHCHNLFPLISTSIYSAAQDERIPIVQSVHNYRMGCLNGLLLYKGQICERCRPGQHTAGMALGCYRGSYTQSVAFGIAQTLNHRRGAWHQPSIYIAPGQHIRERLIAWGVPEERVVFKPHFVMHDPGKRASVGRYALFVGRLAPEKGLDLLLDVWSNDRLPLVIVGDGPLRARLEQRVRDQGLTNVCFAGQCGREQVSRFFQEARFLVMPSVWLETFGVVVIEAYAHGVPVIATRLGTLADLIRDGVTGRLFACSDCADLAAKLTELEHDHDRTLAMSHAARREYELLYSAPANAQLMRAVYQQAIQSKAVRSE
jgi:glycosyltransferase involved in cell wall biosynthesis